MATLKRYIRPEQIREFSLLLLIILVVIFFGTQISNYYTGRTFTRISTSVVVILVVAVGETLVILTRNVDLSVGSIVGCSAYLVGTLLGNDNNMSPVLAVLIAVGLGALLGLVNGALITYGRIPGIIVTLGTLAIFRGELVDLANAKTITDNILPKWLRALPSTDVLTIGDLDLRLMVVLAVIIVIIFQLVLMYLPYGRRLYAVGSNPDAAHVAGLPVRRIVLTAYILCGALAGLGGFMFLAQFGTITVVAGAGLELQVVAAAVVGGVNIFGGSGTMFGAMLGAVIIATLEQSLRRMAISEFWKDALQGLFILLAVAADALIINRLRTLWARSELQLTETTEPSPEQPQEEVSHVA